MKCRFCQAPMTVAGLDWEKCETHKPVIVYVFIRAPIMQMTLPNGNWIYWDRNGHSQMNSRGVGTLLELDYHPSIKPEEAIEFWDRILKMKAFA